MTKNTLKDAYKKLEKLEKDKFYLLKQIKRKDRQIDKIKFIIEAKENEWLKP